MKNYNSVYFKMIQERKEEKKVKERVGRSGENSTNISSWINWDHIRD
jgi:hypothetical protein